MQKGQVGHGGAVGERRSTAGHGVFGFGEAVKVRSGSLRRGEFWLEVLQRIGEERLFEVWTGEVWSAEARKEGYEETNSRSVVRASNGAS